MSCTACLDALNDLVEGTLPAGRRLEVEAHLQACPSCASAREDLARIRHLAAALDRMTPPPALWERVQAKTVGRGGAGSRPWYLRRVVWAPLATAACLVLAVAMVYVLQQRAAPAERNTADEPLTATTVGEHPELESVASELRKAEGHYENAIRGLERLANDQQVLDPQVAASLQRNLLVIDEAIDESRAAVRAQPANAQAQESLFEAFRTKIVVLQDTIALINEMRKGNQAGAARIAEGLNKS